MKLPNTKTIGERTEAKVLSSMLQIYPTVLLPFGDNQRYDFVFEDFEGAFQRVQCKTGHIKENVIIFNAYSNTTRGGVLVSTPYQGDIDYFGVSCPGSPDVYLVPVAIAGTSKVHLRLEPTKDFRGRHRINWAKDYLLANPYEVVVTTGLVV